MAPQMYEVKFTIGELREVQSALRDDPLHRNWPMPESAGALEAVNRALEHAELAAAWAPQTEGTNDAPEI